MFAASRPVGILLGWVADVAFADPRRGHPVALFGAAAAALQRRTYRDSRWAGVLHVGILLGVLGALAATAQRAAGRFGAAGRLAALTIATWTALGGTSLTRVGSGMAGYLSDGDMTLARGLLPSLCGRDPAALDRAGLTRATVESVAENTSDASVAPLVWAAVGGVPGVLVYRGINTLDAMIGHRSPRYRHFGWAAARVDDVANVVPARLTAVLTAACAPVVGGSASAALRAWRRDAARHPSPNAGVVEAAFAGALGVRLGGLTQYAHTTEVRPVLGDGAPPDIADVRRAVRLSQAVQCTAAVLVTVAAHSGRRVFPRW